MTVYNYIYAIVGNFMFADDQVIISDNEGTL
jgi:hypothetical protein